MSVWIASQHFGKLVLYCIIGEQSLAEFSVDRTCSCSQLQLGTWGASAEADTNFLKLKCFQLLQPKARDYAALYKYTVYKYKVYKLSDVGGLKCV